MKVKTISANGQLIIKKIMPSISYRNRLSCNSAPTAGFPGVGGNTATAIDDQVAGFSPDKNFNIEKGWIKTGPVISHGNSGGVAINQKGELIGVPTMIVTNETDKIGYVRPINMALSLIRQFLP